MAISDGTLSAADIAAVTGNNGFGFGNDGGWWLILLFLFAFNGGWGNGWNNGGNGGVPYVVNDVQRGFDQSAVMNGISGLQAALSNAEVSRCNGLANITSQLTNMAANQAYVVVKTD